MFPKVLSTRVAEGSHMRRHCDKPVQNTRCCIFHAPYGSQSTSEQIKPLDFFEKASEKRGAKPC